MEQYLPFLRSLPLFKGIAEPEILRLLQSLRAKSLRFDNAQIVWEPMRRLPYMCVIVEGGFMILQEDWRGNRSIVGNFGRGDFLSEGAIGAMEGVLPFYLSVQAGTVVILLANEMQNNMFAGNHRVQLTFLHNLADVLIQREVRLLYKIEYLSKRTTREKLMSYLTIQSARQGSRRVRVEFTRQELADFLSVDRSAMCTELSRMQNDGLIRYDRRYFELLDD
jgi:CRP-like cAMP-binding protein